MSQAESPSLKSDVRQFLESRGAFKVRIANPLVGFEKAGNGSHPLDLMKDAHAIIVFAIYMGLDYYRVVKIEGKTTGESRIGHIFRDWLAHELVEFLRAKGSRAVVPSGFLNRERKIAHMSFKLAAHEAGIGLYGKSGIIVTPEYGPRVNIGVVVTDAVLEPDSKLDFKPCQACNVCAKLCPAKAIQANLNPPASHNREKCLGFIQRLRDETGDDDFLCGYCYDQCPVGRTRKRGYSISRQKRLMSLGRSRRERLIEKANLQ